MNDEITYKGVPIEVAKQIAEQYSKDQVIVVTWDSAFGMCHVVTYGKNKDDSLQAAKGGNFVRRALGWPNELCETQPEWYTNEKAALVEACKAAITEMMNADRAIEASAEAEGKHGIYNPWFTDVIKQLQTAIEQAEASKKTQAG